MVEGTACTEAWKLERAELLDEIDKWTFELNEPSLNASYATSYLNDLELSSLLVLQFPYL